MKDQFTITATENGDFMIWGQSNGQSRSEPDKDELWWFSKDGTVKDRLPMPSDCVCFKEDYVDMICISISGKQYVVLSCFNCQCIWHFSLESVEREWGVAWKASRKRGRSGSQEAKNKPRPGKMCQGKQGQIIALNGTSWDPEGVTSISVFDVTEIPFKVAVPHLSIALRAYYLCYCNIPQVGEAIAVTEWYEGGGGQLCLHRLNDGKLLWSRGGRDEAGTPMEVAGDTWWAGGVCSNGRDRVLLADADSNRVIVFNAGNGEVTQVIKHETLQYPWDICWDQVSSGFIVWHGHRYLYSELKKITFFSPDNNN